MWSGEIDGALSVEILCRLEFCDPHQKNSSAEQVQPKKFQIHVLYESIQTEEAEEQNFHGESRVTEEMFERECSKFGRLVDVVIKKHDEVSHHLPFMKYNIIIL